jgi:hypothetical protein
MRVAEGHDERLVTHQLLSVLLDAVPLSGKLVLMPPKQRPTDATEVA